MQKPVLMAIDDNPQSLDLLQRELLKRYGEDYEVLSKDSTDASERSLRVLRDEERQVAIVLLEQRLFSAAGTDFLARVGETHPGAKRGLLLYPGDRPAADAVMRAAALGQVDFWTLGPWRVPDEEFHGQVGEALREWSRASLPPPEFVRLVGQQWSARSHELRDLFTRNRIPYGFYDVASEQGRLILETYRR